MSNASGHAHAVLGVSCGMAHSSGYGGLVRPGTLTEIGVILCIGTRSFWVGISWVVTRSGNSVVFRPLARSSVLGFFRRLARSNRVVVLPEAAHS